MPSSLPGRNRHCAVISSIMLFLFLFVILKSPEMAAQQLDGSISGSVTDTSGGVVAGAKVTVVNTSTNLTVSAPTAKDGSYQFADLPAGGYTVSIAADGFKLELHSQIEVEGNRTTTVNGKLQVGTAATTVTVNATPLLNQTDVTTGYVLGTDEINNTPLGTGSFTQLAILAPGVSADFLNTSGTNAGLGNQAIWANGQRDTSNSFSVNGLTTNNLFSGKSTSQVASTRFTLNTGAFSVTGGDSQTNTSVYDSVGQGIPTPAPETLQEVSVNTANYGVTQGGRSGAQIAVTTRSGTNTFHGELYDNFQNNALNAAPFFRNASTAIANTDKVPKLRYNRYGATLGGPIEKDKIFFFAAYQGIRTSDALSGTSDVTVPLHLTDDRSATALVNVALLDFGKTITASQIDPAALKLLNLKIGNNYLIPTPQITDATLAGKLGYDAVLQEPSKFTADQLVSNVDYNVDSHDRFSVKYFYQGNPTVSPFADSNTIGFGSTMSSAAQTITLSNTFIASPTLTLSQKVGFVRSKAYKYTAQPDSPLDIGINIFNSTVFPGIKITTDDNSIRKGLTIGSTFSGANAGSVQNQFTYASDANWVHGRHTIVAGIDWDHDQLNIINKQNQAATVTFLTFTDMLAGNVATGGSAPKLSFGESSRYYRSETVGAFVQDNFRLTSTMNLTAGLRYDYEGPFTEKYGRLTSFHPNAYKYDPTTDTILNTGLVVAGNNATLGTKGVSNSTLTGQQWGIGPRLGIVWSPSALKNVVVRTGFGMFYDRGEYFTELSPGSGAGGISGPFGITLAPPFIQQVTGAATGTLSSPFAGATIPAPVTSQTLFAGLVPNAAALRAGTSTYVFGGYDPANKLPYTENWTLDLQWQPINTLQLTLGYTGSQSFHQVLQIPFNQPGIATPSNPINGETSSYGFNVISTENVKTFDGGNTDLRVPYLGLSNNSVFYEAEGIANYNALQIGVRKQLSHGLQVTGSYTWSHTLDEQSGLGFFFNGNNPLDPRSSYGTSTYDRTHVISVQYSYSIPKVTSNDLSILGELANGWGVNGVTILQSGFPFNVIDFSGAVAGQYYSHFVNIIDPVLPLAPGVSAKQALLQGTTGFDVTKPYLDANAFYIPTLAPGTNGVPPCVTSSSGTVSCDNVETGFGSTGRNIFRGPFQERYDMSAQKKFKLSEKVSLKYQADFFNIFNHPSFDAPTVSTSLYNTNSATNIPAARAAAASFGIISHTIGSPRFIQMSLHLTF